MGAKDVSSVSQKRVKIKSVDSTMAGLTMLMDCCCPWGMYLPRTAHPNTVFHAMGEFLGLILPHAAPHLALHHTPIASLPSLAGGKSGQPIVMV